MNFTKKNLLFDALTVDTWSHENGKTVYKNVEAHNLFSFGNKIDSFFNDFKKEFQENIFNTESEKYVSLLMRDIFSVIKGIESCLENDLKHSLDITATSEETWTPETVERNLEEINKYKINIVELMVKHQLSVAYDLLDYVKIGSTEPEQITENKPNTKTEFVANLIEHKGIINQELTPKPKLSFTGKKIDLIVLFFAFQVG